MKFILQLLTLIFISNLLIAEENLVLDKIDVYTATPLPSIGLPMDMVPANIQIIDQEKNIGAEWGFYCRLYGKQPSRSYR